jgi:hypothetical protein
MVSTIGGGSDPGFPIVEKLNQTLMRTDLDLIGTGTSCQKGPAIFSFAVE